MPFDTNPELVTLRKDCRRWRLLSGCLAGAAALFVLVAAAAPEALQTVLNGDVSVTGSLKCKQVQIADSAAFNGSISVKKKLTAEEVESPTINQIHEAIAAIRRDLALSRPYVVATMPSSQDPEDASNPRQFSIDGLQAEIPKHSLPAIVVATIRVRRPPRSASIGTMDFKINGVTLSVVEIADFGHATENTYMFTFSLPNKDDASSKISVTGCT